MTASPGSRRRSLGALSRPVLAAFLVAASAMVPAGLATPSGPDSPGIAAVGHFTRAVAGGSDPLPTSSPPTFADPNWGVLNVSGGAPPGAVGGSLAYDAHSGYVVWVGGADAGQALTWTYRDGAWANQTGSLSSAPPASPGAMLAADPVADSVVWAGAVAGSAALATWSFSNGSWSNLTADVGSAPPSRGYGSMTFDPASADVVLFGGESNGLLLADTWTLGGSGWAAVSASTHPGPREFAGLAYDASVGALLLAGGVNGGTYLNDTWSWSSGTWTEVVSARTPAGLATGTDALAPAPGGHVVGFGGSGCAATFGQCNLTFAFLNGSWSVTNSSHAPSPRAGLGLVYDGADGYVLAFGGSVGAGAPDEESWALGGPITAALRILPAVPQPDGPEYFLTNASGGYGPYSYNYTGQNVDCKSVNSSYFPCPLDGDDNGYYNVTVRVTDSLGNTSSDKSPVYVEPTLNAFVVTSGTAVDVGQAVTVGIVLTKPSVGSNYTWSGLPPDCPFTYQRNFTCASDTPGFYGIDCTVVDTWGATVITASIGLQVNAVPSVVGWPSSTSGPAPLTVHFTSFLLGGTAPYTYVWNFSDGTYSNEPDPVHTFNASGTYPVNLRVTDSAGVTVNWTTPVTIEVGNGLSVHLTATAPQWMAPAQVALASSVSGGQAPYTYAWSLGNGENSSAADPSVTFAAAGTYSIGLTVTDALGVRASAYAIVSVTMNNSLALPSGSGSGATPPWELAGIGIGGVIAGAVVGALLGVRRRSAPDHESD